MHTLVQEIESELLETAKEADRQKAFVEKHAKQTAHRLEQVRQETLRTTQRRLQENSALM
jgi:hypothetical protein